MMPNDNEEAGMNSGAVGTVDEIIDNDSNVETEISFEGTKAIHDNASDSSDISIEVLGENIMTYNESDIDLMKVLNDNDNVGDVEEISNKRRKIETIDLDEIEQLQQAIELSDFDDSEEEEKEEGDNNSMKSIAKQYSNRTHEHKPVRNYKCPICMEPPIAAVITNCGHIFCNDCLFPMINSSKKNAKSDGICALCRSGVKSKDIRLVILKKKKVPKSF